MALPILYFSNKLDVNEKNKEEITPLIHAIKSRSKDTAHYLIAVGADIHSRDKEGKSALHYAVIESDKKTYLRLVVNGARVIAKDKSKKSALDYASEEFSKKIVRKYFFKVFFIEKNTLF